MSLIIRDAYTIKIHETFVCLAGIIYFNMRNCKPRCICYLFKCHERKSLRTIVNVAYLISKKNAFKIFAQFKLFRSLLIRFFDTTTAYLHFTATVINFPLHCFLFLPLRLFSANNFKHHPLSAAALSSVKSWWNCGNKQIKKRDEMCCADLQRLLYRWDEVIFSV